MKNAYEMIEAKLNAVHAVLTEAQNMLRWMRENGMVAFKDDGQPTSVPEVRESGVQQQDKNTPAEKSDGAERTDTKTCEKTPPEAIATSFRQDDLFSPEQYENAARRFANAKTTDKTASTKRPHDTSGKAKTPVRHRGDPAVNRKAALQNFREIVQGREVIHLADVNRIFGYNESTSGNFVRDAVKDGRLATIDYGKCGKKFLAKAVREFIKTYFDAVEGKGEK